MTDAPLAHSVAAHGLVWHGAFIGQVAVDEGVIEPPQERRHMILFWWTSSSTVTGLRTPLAILA
eukprot:5482144-Amphidinium_carterae.2